MRSARLDSRRTVSPLGVGLPALLLLLLAASGCDGLLGLGEDRLESARDRWRSNRPASYRFTYRRLCFCPWTDPVVVTVDADSVADVSPASGSDTVRLPRSEVRTVDGLFDLLRDWRSRDPDRERISFHDRLGYPTEARFDFRDDVIDEEQGFEVTDLHPVERLE